MLLLHWLGSLVPEAEATCNCLQIVNLREKVDEGQKRSFDAGTLLKQLSGDAKKASIPHETVGGSTTSPPDAHQKTSLSPM